MWRCWTTPTPRARNCRTRWTRARSRPARRSSCSMSTTSRRPASPGTGRTRQTTGQTCPPRWRGAPRARSRHCTTARLSKHSGKEIRGWRRIRSSTVEVSVWGYSRTGPAERLVPPGLPLRVEVDDRAALGDHRRVGRRADVLLDPFGGTPRGLVRAGLVLADRDSEATLAAPKSCVADEAGHPSDEVLDLLVPLLELLEELRSTLPGVAANDCVHHCLLRRRGGRTPYRTSRAGQICRVPRQPHLLRRDRSG